ncbi:MAG: AAA-like domain protein [Microgenomates group bacterium ADurb.Bin219]|nr:MAG: AAA-like domain protein [Microgenomates group bacterium ADurb.Bin219]
MTNLTQNQRILVAFLYLMVLVVIFKLIGGDFGNLVWNTNIDSSIWFYSGAFMIILGSYIVEPFFTKPSDVIANSSAVLISLFGLSTKNNLLGYSFIFYYSLLLLILSILTIMLKEAKTDFWSRVSKSFYWFVETFGASKVIFSIVYLSAAYSYFVVPEKIIAFICVIAFWICLTFFDVIGLIVERITKLLNLFGDKVGDELGQAIGCENPLLYKIEIDYTKHKAKPVKYGDLVAVETSINTGSIGMVVDTKYLLNKRWLSIYLIQDKSGEVLKINLKDKKLIAEPKSIFAKENLVFLLNIDELTDQTLKKAIEENLLYKDREQFIGYVSSGSNINMLNFSILRDTGKLKHKISEGAILKTLIYDQETLYQVINGNAKEENLENFDRHGFIIGIARKLGKYNMSSKDLDVCKWMPAIFSPLFFAFPGTVPAAKIKSIAKTSIGRLPDTDLEIPLKDIDAIVTHNTAILGILGIGKSCLSYELIQRVTEKGIKVVCIDITNEYKKELPDYLPEATIVSDDENAFNSINSKYEFIHTDGTKQNPDKSGNIAEYKIAINKNLCKFLFGQDTIPDSKDFETTKKVRILNLDYHKASKGEKIGFNVITTDLTQAEKTRVVAEELFKILMKIPLLDEKRAKVLLVFEEAHSLIPEWNSVASEGDKNATNGTAKVILQGRKYGLGSLVITQRTANVSKSILNQCNTIFALRVFDDTGKGFLENYIGEDYANTLATLEERHAIAIGKGLKLKQPVIIQLNDRENIIIEKPIEGITAAES